MLDQVSRLDTLKYFPELKKSQIVGLKNSYNVYFQRNIFAFLSLKRYICKKTE